MYQLVMSMASEIAKKVLPEILESDDFRYAVREAVDDKIYDCDLTDREDVQYMIEEYVNSSSIEDQLDDIEYNGGLRRSLLEAFIVAVRSDPIRAGELLAALREAR